MEKILLQSLLMEIEIKGREATHLGPTGTPWRQDFQPAPTSRGILYVFLPTYSHKTVQVQVGFFLQKYILSHKMTMLPILTTHFTGSLSPREWIINRLSLCVSL